MNTAVTCYDRTGKLLDDGLVQWDINVTIQVGGADIMSAPNFHFCQKGRDFAYVVPSEIKGDKLEAAVPNICLQSRYPLVVFLYYDDSSGEQRSRYMFQIPITPRERPMEYVYTENIGYEDWHKMTEEARRIIEASESLNERIKRADEILSQMDSDVESSQSAERNAATHEAGAKQALSDTQALKQAAAESAKNAAASEAGVAANAASARDAAEVARDLQTKAADAAIAAKASEDAAKASETAASDRASAAEKSASSAEASKDEAADSANLAKTSEDKAAASASNASDSEVAASASRDAAEKSAASAKLSEDSASASEKSAANSAEDASASEMAANISAANAKKSEIAAKNAQEDAAISASAADASATSAKDSETEAENYSTLARSYTDGDTGLREGEEVDSARYYYEQAKRISQGLAGALLPMGTITFEELKTQTTQAGYMYNISDDFITDDTFREGAGHAYPAGTNVYYTADGYWDCLAGAQVVSVNGQTGAVTLDKEDVGLGNVDDTADKDKNVASAAKLTTPRTINGVAFDGTNPITVYDDTKTSYLGIIADFNAAVDPRRDLSVCTYIWNGNTANTPYSQQLTPWLLGFGISFYSDSDWQMQYTWSIDGSAYMRNKVGSTAWSNWHKAILDAYPVGSYYWSSEPTSPASIFGGTWTQITGRFILAAGDGYAAGGIGGAASVTSGGTALTADQIAAHVHSYGTYTSASGSPTSAVTVGITGYADVSGPKSGLGMTDVAGGGQPHAHTVATMPPYIVAYCWRRVA